MTVISPVSPAVKVTVNPVLEMILESADPDPVAVNSVSAMRPALVALCYSDQRKLTPKSKSQSHHMNTGHRCQARRAGSRCLRECVYPLSAQERRELGRGNRTVVSRSRRTGQPATCWIRNTRVRTIQCRRGSNCKSESSNCIVLIEGY